MKKEYTILHISDLHKPYSASYDSLFSSLCIDCDNYTVKGIKKPEIIVVSGDLVEGSKEPDNALAEQKIKAQYQEVHDFLCKLVDYFLDGDKRRIIIVPGNHDFFRGVSVNSMVKETVADEKEIHQKRQEIRDGQTRWNWSDLSFYTVNDKDLYKTRFRMFVNFYNNFFGGIKPERIWPEPCEEFSQIVDLPEYNICFFGLNSCYKLDHLNASGAICPKALTSNQRTLNSIAKRGSLIVGVWHHHTIGLPCEDNYLDYRILQSLIGSNVKLGLYGHQHLTSILNEYHDLTQQERILLISSGSLYGSRNQLVTGYPRQYNLLSLSYGTDEVSLKLRVRKDLTNYEIPSWSESLIGNSTLTEYDETIKLSTLKSEDFINGIDEYVQSTQDFKWGMENVMMFADLDQASCFKFADSYLSKISDPDFVIEHINQPKTDTQFVHLLKAAVDKKNKSLIALLIADERYNGLCGPMINFLREEVNKIM